MTRALAATAALCLFAACSSPLGVGVASGPPPDAAPDSERALSLGRVVGFAADHDTYAWRGIPFARPPVGELRWRAPQPPEPWTGTLRALSFSPACTQRQGLLSGMPGDGPVVGSEDCLYLNLWAPRARPRADAKRPVMLWIHGGGNSIGQAGTYDGATLAGEHQVVVVTVNYRLGPFGWFRHPALRGADATPDDRSGNFGTLDHIRALEWVRAHIAAFGGDPDNITVFGESAGGTNVIALLASPRARGLFHRAIAQSGGGNFASVAEAEHAADAPDPGHRNSSAEVVARLVEAHAGGTAPRVSALASFLRARTPAQVFDAYGEGLMGMLDQPQVFRDGHVLPDARAETLFAQPGAYNRVPAIFGTNRDETRLFMFFGSPHVWHIPLVPYLANRERYFAESEYGSKEWKLRGADELARALRRSDAPVYVYRFDWDEHPTYLWTDLPALIGAAHGLEIPFVFGSVGEGGTFRFAAQGQDARQTLSAQLRSYWTQFAYTGAPGRGRDGTLPEWSVWDATRADAPKFMVLDTAADGGLRMSSDEVLRDTLVGDLLADARLGALDDRCQALGALSIWAGPGGDALLDAAGDTCSTDAIARGVAIAQP